MKLKTLHILGNWIEVCTCTQNCHSLQELNVMWKVLKKNSEARNGWVFFFHWCLNLSVIFIKKKKASNIKLKKQTNKQLWNWSFGKQKERDREGLTCTHYQELSHNLRRVCPWIRLLWILLRIPASGLWPDWVLLLFLLLLSNIKQVTDLILVSLSTKWIGVLVPPPPPGVGS